MVLNIFHIYWSIGRIFFYQIPLARRMKNRIPHGWMIPQYRTLKSKLPKYRLKKSSIPQYRKPPCPPPIWLHATYHFLLSRAAFQLSIQHSHILFQLLNNISLICRYKGRQYIFEILHDNWSDTILAQMLFRVTGITVSQADNSSRKVHLFCVCSTKYSSPEFLDVKEVLQF